MRGAVPQGLPILSIFLGISLVSMLLECISPQSLNIDVPQCSSYAQCYKIARIEGSESYSSFVAQAWYHANRARTAISAVYDICTLNLGDKNVSDIPRLVFEAMRGAERPAALSVLYTDKSVHSAVQEIALILDELERGGARFSEDPELSYYYSVFLQTLEGVRKGEKTTGIAERVVEYRKNMAPFISVLSNVFLASVYAIPYVGKTLKWSSLRFASVYALGSTLGKVKDLALPDEPDIINLGVGRRNSVWSALSSTLRDYHACRSAMDEQIRGKIQASGQVLKEITETSVELQKYELSGLTPEIVSRFAGNRAKKVSVSASLPEVTESYILEAKKTYRDFMLHSRRFLDRDNNFFVHYDLALKDYKRLESIRSEMAALLSELQDLASSCADYLHNYEKRARSESVKLLLPGIAKTVKDTGDLGECARGVRLTMLDQNYANDEAILRACEKSIACHGDYYCAADVHTCLQHCLIFREKKRAEIMSSHRYFQYLELRSATLSILSRCPDAELEAQLLALPHSFTCWEDLDKAVSDALILYKKVKKLGERCIRPDIFYEGYFDADEAAKLYATFSVDAGPSDLELAVDLPFEVITYWVEDANGLIIAISGSKAHLRGSGYVRVGILSHPVSLAEKKLGFSGEYVTLLYSNRTGLPVRKRIYGRVISTAGDVGYDGNYIYFNGYGSAVVALQAVSVEYLREEDRVLVDVTNTTAEEFSGNVLIPYGVKKAPSYCTKYGDFTVCRLNLDPFEKRSFELKGIVSELNDYSVEGADATPSFSQNVPMEQTSTVLFNTGRSTNNSTAITLRSSIDDVLSRLYAYLRRAEELNVVSLLPYTEDTLDNIYKLASDTNDTLILSTVLSVLRDQDRSVRSRASSLVYSLARFSPDAEYTRLAKNALSSGDYVLAMAIAYSSLPHSIVEGKSIPIAPVLLGILSMALLIYYLKKTYRPPRIRKRIPKI